jgi:hypothetical protein
LHAGLPDESGQVVETLCQSYLFQSFDSSNRKVRHCEARSNLNAHAIVAIVVRLLRRLKRPSRNDDTPRLFILLKPCHYIDSYAINYPTINKFQKNGHYLDCSAAKWRYLCSKLLKSNLKDFSTAVEMTILFLLIHAIYIDFYRINYPSG